ncbi:Zn-ribbon domain-containing OB-fold protein [Streptomyces sp. NPDC048172]|uniref:Zn-ribbon domain-containing OB-fold protein n=1 Tax=Streptomyces sp. NPDC048172 TaxID=3365505 RepID=UPI003717B5F1
MSGDRRETPDRTGPPDDGGPDALFEKLKAYEGQPAAQAARGRDPVNTPMIRHWCEAMGHPAPPDGSAPATMLQVWTMPGLDRGRSARASAYDELLGALDEAGCTSVVATDSEQEYARPLRPGDEVGYDAVIESVSPRKTTKLGTGYFVTTRMDIRRAGDGALVGTHRFRILKYRPAARSAPRARRPRPVVNRDNAGFWEGVSQHRLLVQRCDACAALRFPWLPGCNACGSDSWTAVEASGRGTVYSYVVMHHPPFPAFDVPYAVALVELAEGVRMISNITGVPHDRVRVGMPVELEFLRVDDELELPVFRARTGDEEAAR